MIMNDNLLVKAMDVVIYCDYHRPESDKKPHIKEFIIDDMYKLLQEIIKLNQTN